MDVTILDMTHEMWRTMGEDTTVQLCTHAFCAIDDLYDVGLETQMTLQNTLRDAIREATS